MKIGMLQHTDVIPHLMAQTLQEYGMYTDSITLRTLVNEDKFRAFYL